MAEAMDDDWEMWDELDELEMEAEGAGGFHDGVLPHDHWHEDSEEDDGGLVVSAWDVGAGFALAGWLLDHQTDRIVDALREFPASPPQTPTLSPPRRPRVPPGPTIDWDVAPLGPGDKLERSRLAVTLALRVGSDRPLKLEAVTSHLPGPAGSAGRLRWEELVFLVVATTVPGDPPLVAVLRQAPRGFSEDLLAGVFSAAAEPGFLVARVDSPQACVMVLDWALARHGLALRDFMWSARR